MSFKDEYEVMTSVPHGHDAFYILSVPRPEIKEFVKKKKQWNNLTKLQKAVSALMTPEERAERRRQAFIDRSTAQSAVVAAAKKKNPGFGSLLGLSQAGDERIRQHKEREKAITARKPQNDFNTPIATQAQSDRTNSIARTK